MAGGSQDIAGQHVGPPTGWSDSGTTASPRWVNPAGTYIRDGKAGRPVAVLRGGLAIGVPSSDAVLAEHGPLLPGGGSCRACGFVYTDHSACPAVILAEAGFAELADRVRPVPEADREYAALCELSVEVQRMAARLDVIGAHVLPATPARRPRHRARSRRIFGLPIRRWPAVSR
jgi:hypothetical protein